MFGTDADCGVYARATFSHETVYLRSGFALNFFCAQTGLCVTGTMFRTAAVHGVYARAPLFYETVYLRAGFLLLRAIFRACRLR